MDQDSTGTTAVAGALTERVAQSGPIGFLDVLTMGADVADALAARPAAHGDVRPGTIVEDPAAGEGAWSLREPGAGGSSPAVATAPELAVGAATGPGDVYALGAALVFALTGHPFEPASVDTGAEGADRADGVERGGDGSSSPSDGTDDASSEDRTLPEVMASFLAALRSTFASEPDRRPAPAAVAGTLRQLRSEAVLASEGVAPSGTDLATQVVMIAADGRLLNAQGQVIGTTRTRGGAGPQWLPLVIAAVALLVAVGVVVAYVRRPEPVAMAPVTVPSTTTTTVATTTTSPPETVPPSTLPAGLVAVRIDTSKSVSCKNCVVPLRSGPSNTAGVTAQLPDKTELYAKCFGTGDNVNESGYNSNQWLLIQGPSGIQGWISIAWVGRQNYGLPACPPVPTPAPTTTAPPETVPTTVATTVPSTPPPTTATTMAPTTTRGVTTTTAAP